MKIQTIGMSGLIVLCALALSNPSFCVEYYCLDAPLAIENGVPYDVTVWTEDDSDGICTGPASGGTFDLIKVPTLGVGRLVFSNVTLGWSCGQNSSPQIINNYDCTTGTPTDTLNFTVTIVEGDPGNRKPEEVSEGETKKRFDPGAGADDAPTILDRRHLPTLSEWCLYGLALLLMMIGTWILFVTRRRRSRLA